MGSFALEFINVLCPNFHSMFPLNGLFDFLKKYAIPQTVCLPHPFENHQFRVKKTASVLESSLMAVHTGRNTDFNWSI